MQQFHLLNKTLRSIFTKLTHRACNSPALLAAAFTGKDERDGRLYDERLELTAHSPPASRAEP